MSAQVPHPEGTRYELSVRQRPWVARFAWGIGCLTLLFFAIAILFPVYASARWASRKTQCLTNLKDLAKGLVLYSADHADRLPPAKIWRDATASHLDSGDFRCPLVERSSASGYAFSARLGGHSLNGLPDPMNTVLLFESTLTGSNPAGGLESLPRPPRHGSVNHWAFADGAVKAKGL